MDSVTVMSGKIGGRQREGVDLHRVYAVGS